jgi:hypothetical protein
MLDVMFSFIDLIMEATEDSLHDFIYHREAFFDVREEKRESQARIQRPLTEATYKEMWMLRYQQHLGHISFLELLDKYEEILGISPHTYPATSETKGSHDID